MNESEIMKEIETLLQIARFVNSDYVTSPFETKVLIAIQDLINRKNAEIEKLENIASEMTFENEHLRTQIDKIKAEAIKEFAERVKALLMEIEFLEDWDIDKIAKEMGVEE